MLVDTLVALLQYTIIYLYFGCTAVVSPNPSFSRRVCLPSYLEAHLLPRASSTRLSSSRDQLSFCVLLLHDCFLGKTLSSPSSLTAGHSHTHLSG